MGETFNYNSSFLVTFLVLSNLNMLSNDILTTQYIIVLVWIRVCWRIFQHGQNCSWYTLTVITNATTVINCHLCSPSINSSLHALISHALEKKYDFNFNFAGFCFARSSSNNFYSVTKYLCLCETRFRWT